MPTGHRFKQIASLNERLFQQAKNLRKQAKEMPPSIRRDELLKKARQAETAGRLEGSR